jgi:nucleotide-binding universal stress UspA family protein
MKVILATDGSTHSEDAAWLLAHLPHSDKLELVVLYVSNAPNLRGSMNDAELIKRIEIADELRAKSIFQHVNVLFEGANASLELVIAEGHIGTTIVNEAKTRESHLIVLGAVGHSLFERMLGSISDFVATHAHCSVLVVRPTGLEARRRPIDLCIAYDESEPSAEAIKQLGQFGWGAKTNMDVIGVVTIPFVYSEIPYEFDLEEIKDTKEQAIGAAAEELSKLSPNVKTHLIDSTHVGDALVEFAKKRGSDVIVMGNTGDGMLSRFLVGSTSRYVLRHAKCSVWIARKHAVA